MKDENLHILWKESWGTRGQPESYPLPRKSRVLRLPLKKGDGMNVCHGCGCDEEYCSCPSTHELARMEEFDEKNKDAWEEVKA